MMHLPLPSVAHMQYVTFNPFFIRETVHPCRRRYRFGWFLGSSDFHCLMYFHSNGA